MEKEKFDLIVIGGGAGAFGAVIKANELGAKTAVVNSGLPWGGTCVNVGCVPSKALIHSAEVLNLAKNHKIPGIDIKVKNFDFEKVIKDELALVRKLRREKYQKVLESLNNVKAIRGKAKFISPKEVKVGNKILTAEKFILATGSTASVPPIQGLKEAGYLTHISALRLKRLPQELAIIGAGPVGLEFSQMFARFGSKVFLFEVAPKILPKAEPELTELLTKILTKEGIEIYTNTKVLKVETSRGKKIITYQQGRKLRRVKVEEILLAAGKTPNTKDLNLDLVGVKVNKKGAIIVNSSFQTSNPDIFAVGDVVDLPLRLETTAGREGTLAAENALLGKRLSIDYLSVPYTIFTDPELASVGLTEKEQMEKMGVCACRTVDFSKIPKALITKISEGVIKMAIDPKTKRIQGVHILSFKASEIINQAALLIKNKNTIDDLINSLPVFPTFSESLKITALSFYKDISKLSCCI